MEPVVYWLLDANVLITAEHAGVAAQFEQAVSAFAGLVEEVHDEVTRQSRHPWNVLNRHALPLIGRATQVYGAWRGRADGANDAGEHASIALAFEEGWGFVTDEKVGAFLALRQLPIGHVASLEAWLRSHVSALGQPTSQAMLHARAQRNSKALPIF